VRHPLTFCLSCTHRGAASLDWSKRPGNYPAAGSVLKGWVRTAVPIPAMVRAEPCHGACKQARVMRLTHAAPCCMC